MAYVSVVWTSSTHHQERHNMQIVQTVLITLNVALLVAGASLAAIDIEQLLQVLGVQ